MPTKNWEYIPAIPSEMEIPEMTLVDLLRNSADKYPEREYTYFEGKTRRYQDIENEVNQLAHVLQKLGIKKGDTVAALLPNCPQYIVAFFAAQSLGAIFTAISPLYSPKEMVFQLIDSDAKILITLDIFLNNVREIKDETNIQYVIVDSIANELPGFKKVLYKLFIGRKNPKIREDLRELDYREIIKNQPTDRIITEIDVFNDVAALQYTGGTTGTQKGAMLTHRNLISNAYIISYWDRWLPERPQGQYKCAAVLPFSHIFGLTTSFLWPTLIGAKIFLFPDPRKLEVIMKSIHNYKIEFLNAVPVFFQKVAEHPKVDKYNLNSLLMCISGGEKLPMTTIQKFEGKTGCVLIEGYGLSEASPVTHVNPATAEKRKVGTIGIPIPNTLAMVVDPATGKEVPLGETGELWIRGPGVMKGYWKNKEATDQVLVKGWLRTGDIATQDEEGYFTIVDRLKEMIIISGYKVWPKEVEEVLMSQPAINSAAVIGHVEGDKTLVKAVLVAEPGHKELSLEEIRKYCKQYLAPYKVPRMIEYVEELPRSVYGKVLRRKLREKIPVKTQEV